MDNKKPLIAVLVIAFLGIGFYAIKSSREAAAERERTEQLEADLAENERIAKEERKRAEQAAEARRLAEEKAKKDAATESQRLAELEDLRQKEEAHQQKLADLAAEAERERQKLLEQIRVAEEEAKRLALQREQEAADAELRMRRAQEAIAKAEELKRQEIAIAREQARLEALQKMEEQARLTDTSSTTSVLPTTEGETERRTRYVYSSEYKRRNHYKMTYILRERKGKVSRGPRKSEQ